LLARRSPDIVWFKRTRHYPQLLAIARREAGSLLAEDVVQEALLIAVEQGRHDLDNPDNARWLSGVVRNRGRMAARSARRRLGRDSRWQDDRPLSDSMGSMAPAEVLAGLPPALKALAALVLTGHNRREIAYLLDLKDTALRQRISALKRALSARGLVAPEEMSGLYLDLAYGRIRDALLPALHRQGGAFASHDPDGHLFVVRRSQKPGSRQEVGRISKERSA
jgi:DNA-directed RNA polymerase specialized sigma24 family protein